MIKAVIFDLDGVIVDTEPLNKQCLPEFLATIGIINPPAPTGNIQGLNTKAYWAVIKQLYNIDMAVEELAKRWRLYYLSYLEALDHIPVIPGIPELIDYLTVKQYPLAIASSANPVRIKLILKKVDLAHQFPVIVDGDSYEHSKPAPDCFLLAAKRLNTAPGDCIVIEDSTNGVRAAIAANMPCIGYSGSDHNTDDLSEATIIVKDLKGLAQSLQAGEAWPVELAA
jgi:beta-phosphoglucomutase